MDLTLKKCAIHADRKAIARCPSCANYFCGECVTEHEGRFLCSNCLQKRLAPIEPVQRTRGRFATATAIGIGIAVAWFFFYLVGQLLILIPSNLHHIG